MIAACSSATAIRHHRRRDRKGTGSRGCQRESMTRAGIWYTVMVQFFGGTWSSLRLGPDAGVSWWHTGVSQRRNRLRRSSGISRPVRDQLSCRENGGKPRGAAARLHLLEDVTGADVLQIRIPESGFCRAQVPSRLIGERSAVVAAASVAPTATNLLRRVPRRTQLRVIPRNHRERPRACGCETARGTERNHLLRAPRCFDQTTPPVEPAAPPG